MAWIVDWIILWIDAALTISFHFNIIATTITCE
jgi:hypothetical protein